MTHEPIPGLSVSSSNPPLPGIEDLVQATATKRNFLSIIPPELIKEIIDYLWDNKDALIAYSSV
ncbi:hypothetical protein ARMSODRAFT_1025385 [Armillaria solidipes]|uniref:Uncharacterized protein n=1 Tax=Armillaria solidipes TaxID=1076256 RepID=A0A2H3AYS1_9AGAR|nr:hypothetical protein ARMSODRAFT_1025385 [Armillaria solidipes]